MNTVGRNSDDMDADSDHNASDNPLSPGDHPQQPSDPNASPSSEKKTVIRGARACTVCRTAKMRCIGGDDQASHITPCNRCKKSGVPCIFERHRRGRKPGSKLSDSSKLRRLSKDQGITKRESRASAGPSTAHQPQQIASFPKLEEQSEYRSANGPLLSSTRLPPRSANQDSAHGHQHVLSPATSAPSSAAAATSPHVFAGPYAPPLYLPDRYQPQGDASRVTTTASASDRRSTLKPASSLEDEDSRSDENVYPSAILAREKNRQSFMATVLNPPNGPNSQHNGAKKPNKNLDTQVAAWEPPAHPMLPKSFDPPKEILQDPIELGLMTEHEAVDILDKVLKSLNPFVNAFDEKLHTVSYIRARSRFLFTVLMMAGCKFFKPDLFKPLQKMSYVFASRCLDEQWKGIEVVQAFCCMVYWKEPEDNRTWSYIGYACRMAVELGLNTYTHHPPKGETEYDWRERRNRERTYLVVFVHDRSLSMQTGRQWMLPEDELVRTSNTWHQHVATGCQLRPEDVVVAAFVQLRLLSAETNSVLHLRRQSNRENSDVNYEMLLNGCNRKLTDWVDYWDTEMEKAQGSEFHMYLLRFFRLHVRLFLNSLGMAGGDTSFSLQALSFCCTSAQETLQIVGNFNDLGVLCFGQDVIAVMSAYAAIFLLKLLRRTEQKTLDAEGTHNLIRKTAAAFYSAGENDSSSNSARAHAHFLKSLVDDEDLRARASQSNLGHDLVGGSTRKASKPDAGAGPSMSALSRPLPGNGMPPQHGLNGYQQPHFAETLQNTGGGGGGRPENLSISTGVVRPPPMMPPGMALDSSVYYSSPSAHPGSQTQRHLPPGVVAGSSQHEPRTPTGMSSGQPNGHHGRSGSLSSGYPHAQSTPPNGMVNMSAPPHLQQAPMQYHQPQPQPQPHHSPATMYPTVHMPMQPFGGPEQPQYQPPEQQQPQQLMLLTVPGDPQVDPQMYTRHMFEQLGILQQYNPYADRFSVMGEQQIYNNH